MECSQLPAHSLVSHQFGYTLLCCIGRSCSFVSDSYFYNRVSPKVFNRQDVSKSYAHFSSLIAFKIKNEFLSKTVSTNEEKRRISQLEAEEWILPVNDCTIIFFSHSRISEVKSPGRDLDTTKPCHDNFRNFRGGKFPITQIVLRETYKKEALVKFWLCPWSRMVSLLMSVWTHEKEAAQFLLRKVVSVGLLH